MPEISQDNFESLYPADPPATPQELRARANSASSQTQRQHSLPITLTVNQEESTSMDRPPVTRHLRLLSETSTSGDNDPVINTFFEGTNESHLIYKRELAHRWGNFHYLVKYDKNVF